MRGDRRGRAPRKKRAAPRTILFFRVATLYQISSLEAHAFAARFYENHATLSRSFSGGRNFCSRVTHLLARGAGTGEADNMEELTYEGYASGGVAVLVEVMTDNRNRTVAEVRHAFSKLGGNLGTDGSVAYLFSRTGLIQFAPGVDEEALMEVALEAGAEDIVAAEDGSVDVTTAWETMTEVRDALVVAGLEPAQAEVTMLPSTEVLVGADTAPNVIGLIDMLEDLDDVQNVYSNADIPDAVLATL